MTQNPTTTFEIDANSNAGAVKWLQQGGEYAVPDLNASSIAVPLTATALGSSATYTGSARDRLNFGAGLTNPPALYGGILVSKAKGIVFADQAGTLYLEESNDNATWTQTVTLPVTANTMMDTGWTYLSKRYYRLRYVNGSTAQTTFILCVSEGAGQNDSVSTLTGSKTTGGTTEAQFDTNSNLLVSLGTLIAGEDTADGWLYIHPKQAYIEPLGATGVSYAAASVTTGGLADASNGYDLRGVTAATWLWYNGLDQSVTYTLQLEYPSGSWANGDGNFAITGSIAAGATHSIQLLNPNLPSIRMYLAASATPSTGNLEEYVVGNLF